ncbi:helix-turn-helix transcriptional regulator [Saccharibacillus qingshengii]|uniref:helix-turn-helix transcriptional regulator n=1 Tax=Saccharibacillus qingshengii TaxID=1763540 RepID=UPI0015577085|nr:helix-turn-helix domain-containing protein [Saccharibacillus qingshengii]
MMEELLSLQELCVKLKISRRHVLRLRNKGMPVYIISQNGRPRFDYSEVREWMRENAKRTV